MKYFHEFSWIIVSFAFETSFFSVVHLPELMEYLINVEKTIARIMKSINGGKDVQLTEAGKLSLRP